MFAKVYDLLMADVDYEKLYQWIKPYLNTHDFIVDAGCGSGYLLVELLKEKHVAIGIDNDTAMLSLSLEKLRSNQLETSLYEHDLRKSLYGPFDVVLMMFDVINYFKGAKKVFHNVYQALDDKGRFIFDIYKTEVLETYHDYIETEDDPLPYTWHMSSLGHILKHQVIVDDQVDHVTQYVYDLDYYLCLLSDLGFKVQVLDGLDPRKHYIIATK